MPRQKKVSEVKEDLKKEEGVAAEKAVTGKKTDKTSKRVKSDKTPNKSGCRSQKEFEESICTLTDIGMCLHCGCDEYDTCDEDEVRIAGMMYKSYDLVLVEVNAGYQVRLVYHDIRLSSEVIAPTAAAVENYPSYIGGGVFRAALDGQKFFEFACRDLEFNEFKSVKML